MSDGKTGPVIINGITPDDPNKPPSRLEVRDMIKNQPKQWNLYLLGLERFQSSLLKEDEPLSYFQIAGIHGRPFTTWPNESWNKDMPPIRPTDEFTGSPDTFGGFCTHSSILFLPWHRPYLALFEAELYKHVNAVANEFDSSQKADYQKAAKTFRMPYWDWARPDVAIFPAEAGIDAKNHVVRPPSGKQDIIKPNPLAAYEFGPLGQSYPDINEFGQFGVNATVRHPFDNSATPDQKSMVNELKAFFLGQASSPKGKNLTERVLYLLQSYPEFAGVSNNLYNDDQKVPNFRAWGSIEDIHNAVHNYTGGNGQMGDPAVSAFDPIFWLHHTNIDRLFAIWQALHESQDPATYVTDQQAYYATYTTENGSIDKIDSPLVPFAKSAQGTKQTFWTSDDVRSTKTFGYVYPETQDWVFNNSEAIVKELNRLYGRPSLANIAASTGDEHDNAVKRLKDRATGHIKSRVAPAQSEQGTAQVRLAESAEVKLPEDRDLKKLIDDKKYLEWLVDIRAEKAALGGNYVVHIFLGEPDDSRPILYVKNHSHVGVFATFGQDESSPCKNCQDGRATGRQITGQIPLTLALVERYLAGVVPNLKPEGVVPYLQEHLHWRVTMADGNDNEGRLRAQLKGKLLVSVVTNEVTISDSPQRLPRYADSVVPRPEATKKADETNGRGDGTGYTGNNY